jgi:hypothetical protein
MEKNHSKKETLIRSLKKAVYSLKNNTIYYNWVEQHSCNAGVVAQAVLGKSWEEIKEIKSPLFNKLSEINKDRKSNKLAAFDTTWKNAIQMTCNMTGECMPKIISDLEEAGLSREDIVHLEYLENPAILEKSGIEKIPVTEETQVGESIQAKMVPAEGFINRILGRKVSIEVKEPIYESVIVGYEYSSKYFAEKENLIKYLTAWINILSGNEKEFDSDESSLQADLLLAISEERFEEAASIRDRISMLA